MPTPLRMLSLPEQAGYRRLPSGHAEWRDGGEDRVLDALEAVTDRSTWSRELARHEQDWETTYHFAPERANVLRGLRIAPDARVLEVGAGCGAVTRWLGETAAVVDAVEPDEHRARAAALRCADLSGVQIFAGGVEEVPVEPAYDAIAIVGVLEYVGGRDDAGARKAMLEDCRRRLRPGGVIACAIENRFGVQYLVGAPEEHLGRAWAGLEGYLEPGPVRTFDRRTLEVLFRRAGLHPRTFGVFPDYKFARALISDDALGSEAASVAWRTPVFPSSASPHPRPRLASEAHVWRGLVHAGLGGSFANSLLVVAGGDPDDAAGAWAPEQLAAFWSVGRRREYATETRVVGTGDGIIVERRALAPGSADDDAVVVHAPVARTPWIAGTPVVELLETAAADELERLLGRWAEHVRAHAVRGRQDLDMGPQHVLVAGNRLMTIDEEWVSETADAEAVIDRGLLVTAIALADRRPPTLWPVGCATVADTLDVLARAVGREDVVDRHDELVDSEARLLATVTRTPHATRAQAVAAHRADLEAALARPLADTALAARDATHVPAFDAAKERELQTAVDAAARLHHEVDRLHREVAARDAFIAALRDGG